MTKINKNTKKIKATKAGNTPKNITLQSNIEIYQEKNGSPQIEIKFEKETLWMDQKQIAEVFGTKISAINIIFNLK